jgi:hypothetical protein
MMNQTLYRAQILLEPAQHQALVEISRREERSISELVRDAIRAYLQSQETADLRERRKRAGERLLAIREAVERRYGVYEGDLLAEAREEREVDDRRVWNGSR